MATNEKFGFGKQAEKKKVGEEQSDVKDIQLAAIESAKLCLHSKPFKKLLEDYKVAERKTINLLLQSAKDEHDPCALGLMTKDYLKELTLIKTIIDITYMNAGETHTDV